MTQKSDNHQVATDMASYFTMMMQEEVKLRNKDDKTTVEVKTNWEHTTVEKGKKAVRFTALFIYGE